MTEPSPGYQQNYQPPFQSQQPQGWQQQPVGQPGQFGWQSPQPPKKKRSKWLIGCGGLAGLAVLIVIIAVIAAVANSGNGVTKNSSSGGASAAASGSAAPSSSAPSSNSLSGPVGTTFTVTETNDNGATVKYSITLDKVIQHARPDNSFDTAPAGDHLAAAEFTIKGVVGTDQDDANNDAAAIGNDQQTYQPGFEGLAAGTNFSSGDFNTNPGSSSIGWVSFEVKNGVKVASVQWSPSSGMSGSAPATWTVSG
jgi:hypothetical protein